MSVSAIQDVELVEDTSGCKLNDYVNPWVQLAVIISVQATVIILSLAGVLSGGFVAAGLASVVVLTINVVLGSGLKFILNREKDDNSEYLKNISQYSPFTIGISFPFVEEVLFRGVLQGGCQSSLGKLFVDCTVSVLGFQFSAVALGAIAIAASVFGALHYFNPHPNSDIQAVLATIGGISMGLLFSRYGFLASFLAHSLNNTFVALLIARARDCTSKPLEIKVPDEAIRV